MSRAGASSGGPASATALGLGCQAPTTQQAIMNAKPEPHGAPTVLPAAGLPDRAGAGWRPEGATVGEHRNLPASLQ